MRIRLSTRLVLGLVLALVPAARAEEELKADTDAGKKFLAEGDALADKDEPTEAVLRYKQAFEQILPNMRKIHFKHEVKRDVTAREDLRAFLIKEIDEDMTPAEFHANELGMKAIGFIPRDFDLKETLVRLYSEEIAAFYDTKTETMHLIKEPAGKAAEKPTFLERLLGKKGGFDKDENKTVIAHELTHALADQNFDLDALQKAAKGDDDRDLALAALVEGEATLTMIGAQMEDWDGSKIAEIPSGRLERVLGILLPLMPAGGGRTVREVPPILSETLIFPYMRGLVFCARLTNDGGWPALDAAYREPPLSTEQILHPEKYRAAPDPPMAVDLGQLDPPAGWKEAGRNVVGEMQLAVLLRGHNGKAAAAGWDGDRFAVFEGPDNRLGLVWATTWDTEDDALEFAKAYGQFQARKRGPNPPKDDDARFTVECRGKDVAIVEGFPADATEALVKAALDAKKAEKTHAPEKPKQDRGKG